MIQKSTPHKFHITKKQYASPIVQHCRLNTPFSALKNRLHLFHLSSTPPQQELYTSNVTMIDTSTKPNDYVCMGNEIWLNILPGSEI